MYEPRGAVVIISEETYLPSGTFIEHRAFRYRGHLVDIVRRNRNDSDCVVAIDDSYHQMSVKDIQKFIEDHT